MQKEAPEHTQYTRMAYILAASRWRFGGHSSVFAAFKPNYVTVFFRVCVCVCGTDK